MKEIITNSQAFLPTSKKEMQQLGWKSADIILFTGDAYIDHPAFGIAIIARILESKGYKVAVIPQPNWQDDLRDFKKLGAPNLFFGLSSGNMDSMINHYTANKRLRHNDAYTPGDRHGARPDYATTVYSNILKKLFPQVPVVIGGIEASLRRICHYDYWNDTIKPSILHDSNADILVYGMGENAIVEIADNIKKENTDKSLNQIPQTAYISSLKPDNNYIELFSYDECLKDKIKFAENFKIIETESNKIEQRGFIQKHRKNYVVINPPPVFDHKKNLDDIYDLPYTRLPHPRYYKKPDIPAYQMIRHSITSHRGCFGGCSFCTISAHQGKFISNRTENSILKEVDKITQMHDFKGTISDIGGPSANMYKMQGIDKNKCLKCSKNSCIYPAICENLNTDHSFNTNLLKKIETHQGVKNVFIGSGIRYDLIYGQKNQQYKKSGKEYLINVITKNTSGRLKVAPEHSSNNVLNIMRKPGFSYFENLHKDFIDINNKHGLKQQIVPYFISSHPGCRIEDMIDMAIKTKKLGYRLEQVQEYTPTPMTFSNVLYYSEYNPYTQKKVYIPKQKRDREIQKRIMFWYKKENHDTLKKTFNEIHKNHITNELLYTKKEKK